MAKVGHCSECGGTVRLCDDGSCAWGHAAEFVTSVREVPDGRARPTASTPSEASHQAAQGNPVPLSISSVRSVVRRTSLGKLPSCPGRGSYSWTASDYSGDVRCSKHRSATTY